MEALLSSLIVDVYEGRDVAIFDVPGAYLNADIPEEKFIILDIKSELMEIMCKVNPFIEKVFEWETK